MRKPSPPPAAPDDLLDRDRLITPGELAAHLNVDVDTTDSWVRSRTGPAYLRIGKYRRYHRADIAAWLGIPLPHRNGLLYRKALIRPEELAEFLQVPKATTDRWASEDTGPRFRKLGKYRRYDGTAVRDWLRDRKHRTGGDAKEQEAA
jgi:predicted DNA-binding transcriptional regulator AlpA